MVLPMALRNCVCYSFLEPNFVFFNPLDFLDQFDA